MPNVIASGLSVHCAVVPRMVRVDVLLQKGLFVSWMFLGGVSKRSQGMEVQNFKLSIYFFGRFITSRDAKFPHLFQGSLQKKDGIFSVRLTIRVDINHAAKKKNQRKKSAQQYYAGSLRCFHKGGKNIFQDQNLACLSTFGRHFLGQVDADLNGRHHDEIPNLFKIKTCSRNARGVWL